jgi:hypothetical protein
MFETIRDNRNAQKPKGLEVDGIGDNGPLQPLMHKMSNTSNGNKRRMASPH